MQNKKKKGTEKTEANLLSSLKWTKPTSRDAYNYWAPG